VRVAGSEADVDVEAAAFALLDLRFADGHVERWLGPRRSATLELFERIQDGPARETQAMLAGGKAAG
jgi:hypothetical protein